jgi:hypothetical protein
LEELRRTATNCPYLKCKEEGDKAFKMGDTELAVSWYTKAVEADEVYMGIHCKLTVKSMCLALAVILV